MTGFNADSFPHLIDLIFEFASPTSLMALRVNRTWRARAEAELAYHISLAEVVCKDGDRDIPIYHLSNPRAIIGEVEITNSLGIEQFHPSFLSSTVVIDLYSSCSLSRIPQILKLNNQIVTYRCRDLSNLRVDDAVLMRCLVLFADPLAPDIWRSLSFGDVPYGGYRTQACDRLVVHFWPSTTFVHQNLGLRCRNFIGSLTIVVHLWPLAPTCDNQDAFQSLTRRKLALVGHMMLAHRRRAPTTIVGFDFSDYESQHRLVRGSLLADLGRWYSEESQRLLEQRNGLYVPFDPTPAGDGPVPTPRFLSMENYRAEVGEEQFRIETDEGPLFRPRP